SERFHTLLVNVSVVHESALYNDLRVEIFGGLCHELGGGYLVRAESYSRGAVQSFVEIFDTHIVESLSYKRVFIDLVLTAGFSALVPEFRNFCNRKLVVVYENYCLGRLDFRGYLFDNQLLGFEIS